MVSLGRDAIFLDRRFPSPLLPAVCGEAAAGRVIPGGYRFDPGVIDAQVVGCELGDAIVFTAENPLEQASIRFRLGWLEPHLPLPELIRGVVTGHVSAPPASDLPLIERARVYGLGGADAATVFRITRLPLVWRLRVLVFVAGMLGQDVADRVREVLGLGPVIQSDIPEPIAMAFLRYQDHAEMLTRFLLLLSQELPPLENTAIHLALGPQP